MKHQLKINELVFLILLTGFVPRREGDLKTWLVNLKLKIAEHGATLGLDPNEITDVQAACDNIVLAIDTAEQIEQDYRQQIENKNQVKSAGLKVIRDTVKKGKAHPGYTTAIGDDMGVVRPPNEFDADNFKPSFKAVVFPGKVELRFKKKGVDGLNFFARLKGETTWVKLAYDTHSPYLDNRPLQSPTAPEAREYMAIGVIKDEQVGLMSDIVSVTFAG